jgi:type II secretory ATPase GspE/PulE/Tfp pilus assembly ATPase PilB-like protein
MPKGCDQCSGIGYKGRRVVAELMPFKSHLLRQLAYQCANPDLIQQQAQAEGMVTIGDAALNLVVDGSTSLAEALTLHAGD